MRAPYDSSQRQRSRQRGSRDRSYPNNREPSPDFDPYRRPYSTHQFTKRKEFNDQEDIRVFKKQDEPNSKSLSQDDILKVKQQIQKDISRIYDFNWDQKKHFDALSQQNSMKEQKQKEKQLYQKLMGMKEEIQFYTPYVLAYPKSMDETSRPPQAGAQSIQKQAHSERIKDVLGCYYTQINQIPNEPIFQTMTQCNKNQPKIIRFIPGGFNDAEDLPPQETKMKNKQKGF